MKANAGLSLIELFVAVIILSILASLALPTFGRAVERAKVREAQAVLVSIYNAERMYRLDQGGYGTGADLIGNRYLTNMNPDPTEWSYTISGVGSSAFTVTAQRLSGSYSGNTIEITQAFDGSNYDCDGYAASLCP